MCIRIAATLMIVLVVDDLSISADDTKCDAPVAADPYRPAALSLALERMEPKAGEAHVFSSRCGIETTENQSQSLGMCRLDPGFGSGLKESG